MYVKTSRNCQFCRFWVRENVITMTDNKTKNEWHPCDCPSNGSDSIWNYSMELTIAQSGFYRNG